ncbi:hypothetical protein DIPPA_52985 [Diplonema papillatum]|nr:hypothetical protein DIPPA_52985 [Diplonema papillatum]
MVSRGGHDGTPFDDAPPPRRKAEAFTVSFGNSGPLPTKKEAHKGPRKFLKKGDGVSALGNVTLNTASPRDGSRDGSPPTAKKRHELRSAIQSFKNRSASQHDKFSDVLVAVPSRPPPPSHGDYTAKSNLHGSSRDRIQLSRSPADARASSAHLNLQDDYIDSHGDESDVHRNGHSSGNLNNHSLRQVNSASLAYPGGQDAHYNDLNPPLTFDSEDDDGETVPDFDATQHSSHAAPSSTTFRAGRVARVSSRDYTATANGQTGPRSRSLPVSRRGSARSSGGYRTSNPPPTKRVQRRNRRDGDYSDDMDYDDDPANSSMAHMEEEFSPHDSSGPMNDSAWDGTMTVSPRKRGSNNATRHDDEYGRLWEEKLQELDAVVSMYSKKADDLRKREQAMNRARQLADEQAYVEAEERTAADLKKLRKERQVLQDRCRSLTASQPQARKDREELEQLQDELILLKDEWSQKENRYKASVDRLQKQLKEMQQRNTQLNNVLKQSQLENLQQQQQLQKAQTREKERDCETLRLRREVESSSSLGASSPSESSPSKYRSTIIGDSHQGYRDDEENDEVEQAMLEGDDDTGPRRQLESERQGHKERDMHECDLREREHECRERELQQREEMEKLRERREREREIELQKQQQDERETGLALERDAAEKERELQEHLQLNAERERLEQARLAKEEKEKAARDVRDLAPQSSQPRHAKRLLQYPDEDDEPEPVDDLPSDSVVDVKEYADGKLERFYRSKKKEVIYTNGTRKVLLPSGHIVLRFNNGDIRKTYPSGKIVYYYSQARTRHTTYRDGVQIFEFESSQQVERHFPDGMKEIAFPDGTLKYIFPDGEEESNFEQFTLQQKQI